ncbi:FAD binding domain-containing protein [Actinomadura livida]|uniref:CO/xanthine dehydrogenase FAD-binding subunit n=1 Tax=Actinomadura livida TaxID=79909 RepID=A0A7W7IHK1_9ACTN|nr:MULTISPECIES: FAD binding domain-containing protein [Actinomadura]MBB4777076.1 CO/xanthine dehydrogenase FAD-binding subunit [Actinomadura catellatispora]GGU37147.1 carbon-monoxide dehydrogenase medium subunit [Actinomadura livida]
MDFLRPATWADALAAKAERPGALPLQGGTDVMVEINFDVHRPEALLDLTRVRELAGWDTVDGDTGGGRLRVGAGVTYTRLIEELGGRLPGLAQASRTVGSPQIRNRGTAGGNLGAASPAGDAHPPLLAGGAEVEAESAARGVRMIPAADFFTGVKRNALEPDELIRAFWTPPASGPQYFSKIGTRNAMVIAVCSFAVALHPGERRVGTGLGSAAPTPRRAAAAEEFASAELDWDGRGPLGEAAARRFGELAAEAASPIDDVRGTGDYRRHALAVLARRTLTWAWNDHRNAGRRAS